MYEDIVARFAATSRRKFLKPFSAALFALGSATGSSAQTKAGNGDVKPPKPEKDDEEFWAFIRKQFMLEPGLIYLNAGTTGAMPRPVFEAEVRYQRMLAENPKVRATFQHVAADTIRKKAAKLIGATLEETALTHNTTEGLNIVAHGLPLKPGDQVLITDQEHPAHREAWRLRSKRDGIEVTQVKIPTPLPDAATFVNLFERAITGRTRVIAIPHIPTTNGMITPAKEICALARSKGIFSLLDGAHCVGQIRLNVKKLGCDFYACSPHKWLHAPLGNGIFYVRKELQNTLWPLQGHGGWDTYPDARKYTTFGNRSWSTAVALGDAIDFANSIGIERIEARQRALMTYFRRRVLSLPGVSPLTPGDPALYCAQSAFRLPGVSSGDLAAFLRDKHRIIVGGYRVDIGYFVTWQELDRTIDVLEQVIRKGVRA